MKSTIKVLITLTIFIPLSFGHIHAKSKIPVAESSLLGRVQNLLGKAKKAVNDKLQTKKKKMAPKKEKSNTLVITLGLGIVISIGAGLGLYWKFKPKGDEDNNDDNECTTQLLDLEALRELLQSKQTAWFNEKDVNGYAGDIMEALQKKEEEGGKIPEGEALKDFILQCLKQKGVDLEEESEGSNTTGDITPVSGVEALKKIMNAGSGKIFHGYDFYSSADKIIKDLKGDDKEMTIEDLRGPVIEALVKGNFDITKENEKIERGYLGKHCINQVEHGLIDGGICASDSVKVLEVLVQLAIELKGEEFVVRNMLNDQNDRGDTVLHNLVRRCHSIKNADVSRGTSLNCIKHIRMLIRYGADPTIVNNKNKSAIDLGKEKMIRCNGGSYYIRISLDEKINEGVRSYDTGFASRAGGDFV